MITKQRAVGAMTRLENWQVVPSQLATVGEIGIAFRYPRASLSQMRRGVIGTPPSVRITQRELVILTASVLQHAVSDVKLVEQCGRFLLIDYAPQGCHDPQMVVAWTPKADKFHEAMLVFQQAREGWFIEEGPWYKNCMEAARGVLEPLARLHPYVAEAEFTIGWLLHTVAIGQRI